MNTELIRRWVRDERLSLADFLAGLSADDWDRASLGDLLLAATGRLEPRTLSPA
ncbi:MULTISPECIES: hypothetical protein [unclassified Nocardia]|uniref:hypothetical protein n=1 Tax=unclassified Nocardia TaxID=2637762 RepID=UPI00278C0CA1|nr:MULTISPECIES: hypothetical protein [unclassified Nocardia]